jgi:hypothetical protein
MRIRKFNEAAWDTGKLTVGELKEILNKYDDNLEVMVLDGFNGGGSPRAINSGPRIYKITQNDIDELGDCEFHNVGDEIILMGYGSY